MNDELCDFPEPSQTEVLQFQFQFHGPEDMCGDMRFSSGSNDKVHVCHTQQNM